MSGGGRTVWWSKDALWHDREYVVILGTEFGPAGPNVLDVLNCQAKLENNGGRFKTGYQSLTRKAFVDGEATTRAIVARAAEIGALDDFTEDRLTFSARVSGWTADQERAMAAKRKADQRAQEALESAGSVTPSHGPSRPVTKSHLTGQDSTEQKNSKNSNVEPRLDERVQREQTQVSELFAYWQEQCGHRHAKLTDDRRAKVKARLRQGATVEEIRTAIDGARLNAHVDDNGVRHDDLELICRTRSKLDLFIKRANANPAAAPGLRGQRGDTSNSANSSDRLTAWCREHLPHLVDPDGSTHPALFGAIFRLGGIDKITWPDDEAAIRRHVADWDERNNGTDQEAA